METSNEVMLVYLTLFNLLCENLLLFTPNMKKKWKVEWF